jgi:DMSO/TMAO reductase YedYZ molybdopterin-dependent catalytic subunit
MVSAEPRADDSQRRGFLAGAIASLPMAAAMLALASAIGLPTLPDLLADPVLFLVPGPLFGLLIDALQFGAKSLLLAVLLEGQLIVCGLVGRAWARRSGQASPAAMWRGALTTTLAIYAAVVTVGLALVGVGPLGVGLPTGPLPGLAGLLLVHLAYALALVPAYRWLADRAAAAPAAPDRERRRFLGVLGATSLALVGGGTLWRALGGARIAGAGGAREALSDEVTPVERFYTVSKNFADPRVDPVPWRLAVGGEVERPGSYALDDLRRLPAREQYFTLACISNLVGGDLIGNTRWRGVRLRDLIEAAGPRAGVRKVVFHAADGYTDSIAFDKAMEDATLLAYEMDGQPLTAAHGLPARLLIPDIYGMKNVKWVTKVELLTRDYRGYWQERGWNDLAEIQTLSRIDVPLGGRTVEGETTIGGVAHAGSRGVKRVEVSVDGGRTWRDAERRPPLSPNSWTIWTLAWTPPAPGQYRLVVRATDGFDRVQVQREADSFPDGATGWHTVTVRAL